MVPTLLVGDHIFVKKGRANVARGDVIVFEFPLDPSTDYVKRVVAIGGDTIEVRDGVPLINGMPLDQTAIADRAFFRDESAPPEDSDARPARWRARRTPAARTRSCSRPATTRQDFQRTTVPTGEVFVLGDNRDNSLDSRKWGTVPVDHIKGDRRR